MIFNSQSALSCVCPCKCVTDSMISFPTAKNYGGMTDRELNFVPRIILMKEYSG